jgi:hypothetical protein
MYTSGSLLALASVLAAPVALDRPAWLSDYGQARKLGQALNKPVAVVLGQGEAGHQKVSREGKLNSETEKILASKYVCVYLDTSTQTGRKLASSFEIASGRGLVLSDHSGAWQAFHHDGSLANGDLTRYVKQFSQPGQGARTTITHTTATTTTRTSYSSPAPVYAPTTFGRVIGGGNC